MNGDGLPLFGVDRPGLGDGVPGLDLPEDDRGVLICFLVGDSARSTIPSWLSPIKIEGEEGGIRIGNGGTSGIDSALLLINRAFALGAEATLLKNRAAAEPFFSGDADFLLELASIVFVGDKEDSLVRIGVLGEGWVYVPLPETEKDEVLLFPPPDFFPLELAVELGVFPKPLYLSFFLDGPGVDVEDSIGMAEVEGLGLEKKRDLNPPRPSMEAAPGDLRGVEVPD